MSNQAFRRALACLAHPISLGAILLVMVNDHLLRRLCPSWWTGKISDLAWILFAPFLLAAVLAWIPPNRARRQTESVGQWAILLTGLAFALVKTAPAFHATATHFLEMLLGCQVAICRDPTDLLTLPALLGSWHLWKQSADRRQPRTFKWVALALAVFSTVASIPVPPDHGITCLQAERDTIVAIRERGRENQRYSFSENGGLTWHLVKASSGEDAMDRCSPPLDPWIVSDPNNPQIQYRFTPGASIERSGDSGQSWQEEVRTALSEAQIYHYRHLREVEAEIIAGPLDALIHSPTGNVVVAMGHEGVLVRTPDGEWRWAAVGPYNRAPLNQAGATLQFLEGEIAFALLLALLIMSGLARHAGRTSPLGHVALALAWVIWSTAFVVLPPAPSSFASGFLYPPPFVDMAIRIIAAITIPIGLKRIIDLCRLSPRILGAASAISISAALLFLLPYALWSQGGIPHYELATLLACTLAFAAAFGGDQCLRRLIPAHASPPTSRIAEPSPMGWRFGLQWLLATTVGFGIGTILSMLIVILVPLMTTVRLDALTSDPQVELLAVGAVYLLGQTLAGVVTGALVGTMQWLIAQRRGPWLGQWPAWTVASAVGWGIGAVPLVLLGATTGVLQWLVLRRRVSRASWWILANTAGWLTSLLASLITSFAIGSTGHFLVGQAWPWSFIGLIVGILVVGSVNGSITGATLVWLLKTKNGENNDCKYTPDRNACE